MSTVTAAPAAASATILDADGNPAGSANAKARAAAKAPARKSAAPAKAAARPKAEADAKTAEKPKPVHEVRMGCVKAAIWENVFENDRGESFLRYNVTVERLYLNGEGKWRGTASFGQNDLLLLAKVLGDVHTHIHEMQMERMM